MQKRAFSLIAYMIWETVTGKAHEVQRWVVLALAADAAKIRAGHQLFASKSADTIQSGIIAAKYRGRKPAAPDIADFSNYWKIISMSIILWCTGYLCLVEIRGNLQHSSAVFYCSFCGWYIGYFYSGIVFYIRE